jgi:hypothetical protein
LSHPMLSHKLREASCAWSTGMASGEGGLVAWPEKGGTCDPVLCTIRIRIIPNHRARKIRKISKSFRAKIASALVGWWMLAVEGPERRGSGGVMAERKASTTGDPSRAELLFDHLSAECASSGGVKGASVAKDVSVLLRSICVVSRVPHLRMTRGLECAVTVLTAWPRCTPSGQFSLMTDPLLLANAQALDGYLDSTHAHEI